MARDPQQPLAQGVRAVPTLGGAAGFYAGGRWARYYNQRFGVIYLLVTALGFVAPALTASQLAINSADNVLHLALGIVLAGVGFGVRSNAMP